MNRLESLCNEQALVTNHVAQGYSLLHDYMVAYTDAVERGDPKEIEEVDMEVQQMTFLFNESMDTFRILFN